MILGIVPGYTSSAVRYTILRSVRLGARGSRSVAAMLGNLGIEIAGNWESPTFGRWQLRGETAQVADYHGELQGLDGRHWNEAEVVNINTPRLA